MARWTALSRRFGILFMGLMMAMGVLGVHAVSASNTNQPPIMEPGAGQPQSICLPCYWGIKNLQQTTLFHASNYPGKSMVEVTFDFYGDETSVAYAMQPANAPNPPAPGDYWNAALKANSHYEADQYLNAGGHYKFYVKVMATNGQTYAQVLDFWAS